MTMQIVHECHVTVEMTVILEDGTVVETFDRNGPFRFVVGSRQIPAGIERALCGMQTGQSTSILIEADEGFGPFDPRLVREMPRGAFPADAVLEPGTAFQVDGPRGQSVPFRIRAVDGDVVQADFNHPLAGHTVRFEVTVLEVRAATPEELAGSSRGDVFCGSCGGGCGDGAGCGSGGCGTV